MSLLRELYWWMQTRKDLKAVAPPDPRKTLFFNNSWHFCGNCGHKELLNDCSQKCQSCGRVWKFAAATCRLDDADWFVNQIQVDYPGVKYTGVYNPAGQMIA